MAPDYAAGDVMGAAGADSLAPPGTGRRVALLLLLLAALMAWLALGGAAVLPWERGLYLPVHTVMEVFSVTVAAMIFAAGWHSIYHGRPRRLALLVPASLAVALLDVGHMLSVPGMPGVAGAGSAGASTGIVFWLGGRAVTAATLLAVALTPVASRAPRGARLAGLGLALLLTGAVYWLGLARQDLLPATFVQGQGLTSFKITAEFAISGVCLLAGLLMLPRARRLNVASSWYLLAAATIMAMSGLPFALYREVDDAFNLAGHVYKMLAYVCLYRAIFVGTLEDPYRRLSDSERSLSESESKFRGLMEAAPDAIVLADAHGRIVMMNACAEKLFAVPREIAAGIPIDVLVPRAESGTGELTCHRVDGKAFPAEVRRGRLASGQGQHDIAIVRDVSERRRLEQALLEQLTHDALTGLPNRRRILEALVEAMAAARAGGHLLAVLVLDIDHFKKVNNSYGYADGDAVLRECVRRISKELRPGDLLARQGGNEFIVLQSVDQEDQVTELAERLLALMRQPFTPRGQQVFLSASIGAALARGEEQRAQDLLHKAQVAMAAARQQGPGRYRFYAWEMEAAIQERMTLEASLRGAVMRGELALQYQPRVSLATGEVVGAEALVRWRHPTLGLVAPGRFIPVAEETGMIEEIDMWVLREACARNALWQHDGVRPVRVSVNLSARQFQQAGLARRVRAVLDETGLPPWCLELEITESTVMHDIGTAQSVLHSLKSLGVALSIDDFGTGYSSLSYLKRFPIDVLKIDRSFVTDVMVDPNDAAIARAVIALAHALGLKAVAEGVETINQVAFLKANGCDEIQGYYYSPPVWPEELATMMVGVQGAATLH